MKTTIRFLVVTMLVVLGLVAGSVAAFAGGPAAHGMDGRTFGAAVSNVAQADPYALADHVSGNVGGIPAAHGVSGAAFGSAVAGLAQTGPIFLASHVSGG